MSCYALSLRCALKKTFLCSLLLALPAVLPAAAQEEPTPTDEAPGPLAAEVDQRQDAVIADGLRQRYRQLDGLAGVAVGVEAGVVRLSGEVATNDAREEAASIARRTAGVAQVVDEVTVARDVEKRLRPALAKLEERFQSFVGYLPLLGVAVLIVAVFSLLARLAVRWDALYRRLAANDFLRDLLRQLVRSGIWLAGVLLALDVLDATALVGAVLGTAGVVGLAVGFAFRDLVENYLASVLLSVRQPFAPNDLVRIGDHEGKVIRLTSRATVLMTLDGNHLRIPNSDVFKGVILNYTRNPLRRFDFGVGVGVDVDLVEAQRLGIDILQQMPGVVDEPEPTALIEELGDSNVQVRYYGWVDQRQASLLKVKSEAIRQVKTALEKADIDMPEPIYRLRLEGGPGPVSEEVPRPGRRRAAAPPAAAPATAAAPADLSPDDAVDRQIAAERTVSSEEDLLDQSAPRE